MRRSVGKYQQMCKDLLWANIRRRAEIFRQISADVRSFAVGKYKQTCKDLQRANISRYENDSRRSVGKYQKTCKDHFANISRQAKICGQISEVVRRSVGKYQQTCEDLWAQSGVNTK